MNLFVYGSLLANFPAAGLIPEEATRRPGRTIGRLYDFVELGYPAIVVPEHFIRAAGTLDYDKDAAIELAQEPIQMDDWSQMADSPNPDDNGCIIGELVEISDLSVMPLIDRYEGVKESNPLYQRSLIPVMTLDTMKWAWVYHFMSEKTFDEMGIKYERIYHGSWSRLIWTNCYV